MKKTLQFYLFQPFLFNYQNLNSFFGILQNTLKPGKEAEKNNPAKYFIPMYSLKNQKHKTIKLASNLKNVI